MPEMGDECEEVAVDDDDAGPDDVCDVCLSSMDEHEDYVRGVAG